MVLVTYNLSLNIFLSPQYLWDVDMVNISFHSTDKQQEGCGVDRGWALRYFSYRHTQKAVSFPSFMWLCFIKFSAMWLPAREVGKLRVAIFLQEKDVSVLG